MLLAFESKHGSRRKSLGIGSLTTRSGPDERDEIFKRALRELGWIDGQNIAIEYRWAAAKVDDAQISRIDRHCRLGRLTDLKGSANMVRESRGLHPGIGRPVEIVREVARLARSILGKDVEVIWFGSWPRGQARPRSDIDVAISIGRPISPEQLALLHEAVDELPTLYGIDLIDLNVTGSALREEILKHGERL